MRYGIDSKPRRRKLNNQRWTRVWRRWRKFRVHIGMPPGVLSAKGGEIMLMPIEPLYFEFNPDDFEKHWLMPSELPNQ